MLQNLFAITACTAGAPAKMFALLKGYQLKKTTSIAPNAPLNMTPYKLMTLKVNNRW